MNKAVKAIVIASLNAISIYAAISIFATTQDVARDRTVLEQANHRLSARQFMMDADLENYAACNNRRLEKETIAPARDCLIKGAYQTKSAVGALLYSTTASRWLVQHADDEEFRKAALYAIGQGRAAILEEKKIFDDPIAPIAKRINASWLLSAYMGKLNSNRFYHMAEILDRAEFQVRMPDVYRQQREWLLTSLGNREAQ